MSSLRLTELVLGVVVGGRPVALRVVPRAEGSSLIPLEGPLAGLDPEAVAEAVRQTLTRPARTALGAELPFLRVVAESGELELTVADDAGPSGRMLTETLAEGMPLVLETDARARDREDRDARMEALLARVALAAGAESPEGLYAALAREAPPGASTSAAVPAEALAFVEAHRRAAQLGREVRALDDRMTASVVPDWLWVATGLGGVGVLLTVVALLAPELRIYVIPAVVVLSLVGFAAYGVRAYRELGVRGRLLDERRALRERREAARAEAAARRADLAATGVDPELLLLQSSGPPDGAVPAVLSAREAGPERARPGGRQVLVLAASVAPGAASAVVRATPMVEAD